MNTLAKLLAPLAVLVSCTAGNYSNPVICADYSDPDVCATGSDYYLTSSSFSDVPGLPILHSRDLVNWEIISHALPSLPSPDFDLPSHGNGVWAPSIRFHDGRFRIYWGDPDRGIFVVSAESAEGPWSEPVCVLEGKGLIDPCPLWDDDGRCYLVHAWAKSRAGFNGVLSVRELNAEGTKAVGDSVTVFLGGEENRTCEGPKFYKRDGWYWIFCPAGGVKEGWQLAMRSRSPYGPYEWRRVLAQGNTDIHGPHQGAWVHTEYGEDWFLHFEDRYAYGRVVHLQPMQWVDGWPVMGLDPDGDGCGEPVLTYPMPKSRGGRRVHPAESDEFSSGYGLQWQWSANPKPSFGSAHKGFYRLEGIPCGNLRNAPNLLMQKLPDMAFTATAKVSVSPEEDGCSGLVMMGTDWQALVLAKQGESLSIGLLGPDGFKALAPAESGELQLRLSVENSLCSFSWSVDGKEFTPTGTEPFEMKAGRWIGAKMGLYCGTGHMDVDWFRVSR